LGQIILPTKEIHAPANAQRMSAGTLLAQEQTAQLPKSVAPETAIKKPADSAKPNVSVAPLETYKGDIEKYVREKNVSVVSAAAAQARQRTQVRPISVAEMAQEEPEEKPPHSRRFYAAFIGGGVICIALAVGLVYFVATRTGRLPIPPALEAPFIAVDGVVDIPVAPSEPSETLLANLEQAKDASTLSLGLIEQLRPILASSTGGNVELMGAQTFLALVSPTIPVNLLRTIQPTFLLGAHTFDTHQPFIILKTDSYEEAFAGMLTWEDTMHSDLSPLFDYTPSAQINGQTSTSTTPTQDSTDTQNTLNQSGFTDAIVENHDARVLENPAGDIYFLWTFIDQNTIVITTNEYTLREIISRLKDAPILIQPGQ
jgi:hypothetical protein